MACRVVSCPLLCLLCVSPYYQAAVLALQSVGGKVHAFLAALPTYGAHALKVGGRVHVWCLFFGGGGSVCDCVVRALRV